MARARRSAQFLVAEPRRRAEKALHAVVVEAYVKGVSTRKVDDLVRALGIDGISRSEVSRICKVLDEEARAFLGRPIEAEWVRWRPSTFDSRLLTGSVEHLLELSAFSARRRGSSSERK